MLTKGEGSCVWFWKDYCHCCCYCYYYYYLHFAPKRIPHHIWIIRPHLAYTALVRKAFLLCIFRTSFM